MRRLRYLAAAGLTAVALTLGLAPSAVAQQQIDCNTHILDATASQGIYKAGVQHQIDMMTALYPAAQGHIYVQAYEQMPGGSVEGFWQLAQTQCPNWFAGAERPEAALVVVAYGHDIDQISMNYGSGFQVAVGPHGNVSLANGVNSSLGPQYSKVNPDYVTSAFSDGLRGLRVFIENAHYFDKTDGIYKPPVYVDPMDSYEPPDWREVAGMIALVAVGFTVFGLFCWFVQAAWRRANSAASD